MPTVLDASVIAEYLVGSATGLAVAGRMARHAGDLHIPHLAAVETTSVMRAWATRGELAPGRAEAAVADLRDLPARRWPAEPLLPRVWALRSNLTAYDATYVALAEALNAELLTADLRLARGLDGVSPCRVVTLPEARGARPG